MKHLTLVEGERREYHDTDYWRHPVHGGRALQTKAVESVTQAFARDGESVYAPRWALQVLTLAVDGNPVAIERHGDALEVLSAHLSQLAADERRVPIPEQLRDELHAWCDEQLDICDPRGMPRPGGVA